METIERIINYTVYPNSAEAVLYWSKREEPTDLELTLIEWHEEVYTKYRRDPDEFDNKEYEF